MAIKASNTVTIMNINDGTNGTSQYVHIRYAKTSSPQSDSEMFTEPGECEYVGIAVVESKTAPSYDSGEWTWSKYVGTDGKKGDDGHTPAITMDSKKDPNDSSTTIVTWYADGAVTGTYKITDGADGKPATQYYSFIRYADDAQGTNISLKPTSTSKYIGTYSGTLSNPPLTGDNGYKWSKYVGDDGKSAKINITQTSNGIEITGVNGDGSTTDTYTIHNGTNGVNGKTYYTHFAYAKDDKGTDISQNPASDLPYIGVANTTSKEWSLTYNYTWSKYTGEDGTNGTSSYTHIAYASDANGSNISQTPAANLIYIGIKTDSNPNWTSSGYSKWTKYIGDKGDKGDKGVDGKTWYTYVGYASDTNGSNFSITPSANLTYMGVCNTTSSTQPTTKDSYKNWSKYIGTDGVGISKVEMYYKWTTSKESASGDYTTGTKTIPDYPKDGKQYFLWECIAVTNTDGKTNGNTWVHSTVLEQAYVSVIDITSIYQKKNWDYDEMSSVLLYAATIPTYTTDPETGEQVKVPPSTDNIDNNWFTDASDIGGIFPIDVDLWKIVAYNGGEELAIVGPEIVQSFVKNNYYFNASISSQYAYTSTYNGAPAIDSDEWSIYHKPRQPVQKPYIWLRTNISYVYFNEDSIIENDSATFGLTENRDTQPTIWGSYSEPTSDTPYVWEKIIDANGKETISCLSQLKDTPIITLKQNVHTYTPQMSLPTDTTKPITATLADGEVGDVDTWYLNPPIPEYYQTVFKAIQVSYANGTYSFEKNEDVNSSTISTKYYYAVSDSTEAPPTDNYDLEGNNTWSPVISTVEGKYVWRLTETSVKTSTGTSISLTGPENLTLLNQKEEIEQKIKDSSNEIEELRNKTDNNSAAIQKNTEDILKSQDSVSKASDAYKIATEINRIMDLWSSKEVSEDGKTTVTSINGAKIAKGTIVADALGANSLTLANFDAATKDTILFAQQYISTLHDTDGSVIGLEIGWINPETQVAENKMQLKKDGIYIYSGGDIVAYFTSTGLKITNAKVLEELTIGRVNDDYANFRLGINAGTGHFSITTVEDAKAGETSEDIPDYVKGEALRVANLVKSKQDAIRSEGGTPFTFLAMSDCHQLTSNANINTGNLHAGMGAKVLAHACDLDLCVFLGDCVWGASTSTRAECFEQLKTVQSYIGEAFKGIPQLRTAGNHDSNWFSANKGTDGIITQAELYPYIGKYNADNGATMGSTTGGYCYYDFVGKKVRVIMLNDAQTDDVATYSNVVDATQLAWFYTVLQDTGKKTGWQFMVMSHHPADFGGTTIISNILKAYIEGTSYTWNNKTYDFSANGSNVATFIADIHGHIHNYQLDRLHYVENPMAGTGTVTAFDAYRIGTPNMCFSRTNEYGSAEGNTSPEWAGIEYGQDVSYKKTAGTSQDTSFVVNVIDLTKHQFFSYHYGAGVDREVNYTEFKTAVTGISLSATSGSVVKGGTVTITANVQPATASNKNVTWSTSDASIATVSNGKITGVAVGTAIITATTEDGGFTATYKITVESATITIGWTRGKRYSASSGSLKDSANMDSTDLIAISRATYPNGFKIVVSGATDCRGNSSPYTDSNVCYFNDNKYMVANAYLNTMEWRGLTCTLTSDRTGITIIGGSDVPSSYKYLALSVQDKNHDCTCTIEPL